MVRSQFPDSFMATSSIPLVEAEPAPEAEPVVLQRADCGSYGSSSLYVSSAAATMDEQVWGISGSADWEMACQAWDSPGIEHPRFLRTFTKPLALIPYLRSATLIPNPFPPNPSPHQACGTALQSRIGAGWYCERLRLGRFRVEVAVRVIGAAKHQYSMVLTGELAEIRNLGSPN